MRYQIGLTQTNFQLMPIIIIIIMEGSFKAHTHQMISMRTNEENKQVTSANPERPDEKGEF